MQREGKAKGRKSTGKERMVIGREGKTKGRTSKGKGQQIGGK